MQSFRIGFLLYPGLTQLDLTGPAQLLSRMPGARPAYLWHRIEPVMSDCGLALMPTLALADCGPLDLVCVPGGHGCTAMMADRVVLDWLLQQAATARLVTSVCTGSLILAAAGLLEGRRAGCHWAWGDQLAHFGATFVPGRIVTDGPFVTAGGVTSGIDFALHIIARLHDADTADAIRLALEYDPQARPGGTPATARPEILARVEAQIADRMARRRAEIAEVAAHYRAPA